MRGPLCLGVLLLSLASPALGSTPDTAIYTATGAAIADGEIAGICATSAAGLESGTFLTISNFASAILETYQTHWNESVVRTPSGPAFRQLSPYDQQRTSREISSGRLQLRVGTESRVRLFPASWPENGNGTGVQLGFDASRVEAAPPRVAPFKDEFLLAPHGSRDARIVEKGAAGPGRNVATDAKGLQLWAPFSLFLQDATLETPEGNVRVGPAAQRHAPANLPASIAHRIEHHAILRVSNARSEIHDPNLQLTCGRLDLWVSGNLTNQHATGIVAVDDARLEFRDQELSLAGRLALREDVGWDPSQRYPLAIASLDGDITSAGIDYAPQLEASSTDNTIPIAAATSFLILGLWLYSLLDKHRIVKQENRAQLIQAIGQDPWVARATLVTRLGMPESSIRYHMRRLIEAAMVREQTFDGTVRYALTASAAGNIKAPEFDAKDPVREVVLARLATSGLIRLHDAVQLVIQHAGLPRSTAWHRVERLAAQNALKITQIGRQRWLSKG